MLQLGRRLAYHGLRPRLVTTRHLLATVPPPLPPFRVTAISDGFDDGGMAACPDFREYVHRLAAAGSETLEALFLSEAGAGRPVRVLVYDPHLPWEGRVARAAGVPTAALFSQPCAVDVVYGEVYAGRVGLLVVDGSALRGVLSVDLGPEDVPSFVAARESYCVFDGLEDADDVFVNSFHELETKSEVLAPAVKGTSNMLKACSAMKVQKILLFAVAKESSKFVPILKETAKSFKGKLLFVFVERDNEEVGEPVANYFGITGQETTVLAYTGNEDAKKFFFSGEISLDNIKVESS
ncbi:hypothetical protein ZWY2020_005247 [Hordeum vulgare]|nr:hypothetical protein ZWY2020_005247 [Hordeum vulgare]